MKNLGKFLDQKKILQVKSRTWLFKSQCRAVCIMCIVCDIVVNMCVCDLKTNLRKNMYFLIIFDTQHY